MGSRVQIPMKPAAPVRSLTPAPFGMLQRKCSCGGSGSSGGDCAECKRKEKSLPHHAVNDGSAGAVPAIVYEVLRSPGQPPVQKIRAPMEPRFGHDFGRVRVNADGKATEPARAGAAFANPGFRADGPLPILFDGIKEVEVGHTDCDWDRSVKPDEPFIPKSGNPKVKIITEDPCVRDCTVQHEAVHVNQVKPICKTYYDCYTAAPAKAATSDECKGLSGDELKKCQGLVTQMLRLECFVAAETAWEAEKWECEAYKTSSSCAEALLSKAKPECSSKIQVYRDSAKKQIDKYCKTAKEENNKKQDGGSGQPPPAQPKQQSENPSGVR
jgi:hypothetical protein